MRYSVSLNSGSVQSLRKLVNGAALKLTTSTYRTAAGRDISGYRIIPDKLKTDDPLTRQDEALLDAEIEVLHQLALLGQLH